MSTIGVGTSPLCEEDATRAFVGSQVVLRIHWPWPHQDDHGLDPHPCPGSIKLSSSFCRNETRRTGQELDKDKMQRSLIEKIPYKFRGTSKIAGLDDHLKAGTGKGYF